MTASAWVMLAVTWTVIGFFTLRFFGRVVRSRSSMATDGDPRDGRGDLRDDDGECP